MMSASPGLSALAKSYERTREGAPRSIAGIPSSTPQAGALARQLKAQGYRFVGPTGV
jgi:DNA-3-methyladenine glycosylase I